MTEDVKAERRRLHVLLQEAFAAIDPTEWPAVAAAVSAELDNCEGACGMEGAHVE